jgi:hypothetical protein
MAFSGYLIDYFRIMLRVILLVIAVLLFSTGIKAQTGNIGNRRSAGFKSELGIPTQYLRPGWHRYWLGLIGGSYYFPVYRSQNFFNIGLEIYPNVGTGMKGPYREWEAGVNVRLGFNFAATENDQVSFIAASGPHWISVEANRQASGFVFSDYFLVNYKRSITTGKENRIYLEISTGIRHVSSAGINMPSDGINSWIIGIGVGRVF